MKFSAKGVIFAQKMRPHFQLGNHALRLSPKYSWAYIYEVAESRLGRVLCNR